MTTDMYDCWLGYPARPGLPGEVRDTLSRVAVSGAGAVLRTALTELVAGLSSVTGTVPVVVPEDCAQPHVLIAAPGTDAAAELTAALGGPGEGTTEHAEHTEYTGHREAIMMSAGGGRARKNRPGTIVLTGTTQANCLHAVFALLRSLQAGQDIQSLHRAERTANELRMVSHWDNIDGIVERGYAGRSIFFADGEVTRDAGRVRDYARLLASVGVNGVCVNNVNVTRAAARLLTGEHLGRLAGLAAVFRDYGIRLFLSVSFDAPIALSGLPTADPLDEAVAAWWKRQVAEVYAHIPDLGGFQVKADSESRPGPSAYGRTQAEGANVLAAALRPHGGVVLWRAFVYNCWQDWRDRSTDRARACYDTFMPLDGAFAGNVIVQAKLGPMDFQVREPASPLLTALRRTRLAIEVQVTQEYTGQQKDLCFLHPQWHEVMSSPVVTGGQATSVGEAISGGVVGVANVGDDPSWTGHVLAQANLYAFGRLAWDPGLDPAAVAAEWVSQTFGPAEPAASAVTGMLLDSWRVYENYTAPLGVGWMVTPDSHYGPSIDGYEYSRWGTYHFADREGIGVDRTVKTGTGFTAQYEPSRARVYEDAESCPDDLLLFFHHVPYSHQLHSGKTVIQHIYDSHFDGAEGAERLLSTWLSLEGQLDAGRFASVRARLELQVANAANWRDVVNTYFFRKSGIGDAQGRHIY